MRLLLCEFLRAVPVHPVHPLRLDELVDLSCCYCRENFLYVFILFYFICFKFDLI